MFFSETCFSESDDGPSPWGRSLNKAFRLFPYARAVCLQVFTGVPGPRVKADGLLGTVVFLESRCGGRPECTGLRQTSLSSQCWNCSGRNVIVDHHCTRTDIKWILNIFFLFLKSLFLALFFAPARQSGKTVISMAANDLTHWTKENGMNGHE